MYGSSLALAAYSSAPAASPPQPLPSDPHAPLAECDLAHATHRTEQNRTDIEMQDITTKSFASLPCLTLPTNEHLHYGCVSIKAGREFVTVCPMSFKYNMMFSRVALMWAAWVLTGYHHVRASALSGQSVEWVLH